MLTKKYLNICCFVKVLYGHDLCLNYGDEFTPTEVREQPVRIFWNADPSTHYTLVFIGKFMPNVS